MSSPLRSLARNLLSCLVAKDGIHTLADFAGRSASREIRWPRTELHHRHKDFKLAHSKWDCTSNQSHAIRATFQQQRRIAGSESDDGKKICESGTLTIRQRVGIPSGEDDRQPTALPRPWRRFDNVLHVASKLGETVHQAALGNTAAAKRTVWTARQVIPRRSSTASRAPAVPKQRSGLASSCFLPARARRKALPEGIDHRLRQWQQIPLCSTRPGQRLDLGLP